MDDGHALRLEEEADTLDDLVAEGSEDPQVVLQGTDDDMHQIMDTADHVAEDVQRSTKATDDDIYYVKIKKFAATVSVSVLAGLLVCVVVIICVMHIRPCARSRFL